MGYTYYIKKILYVMRCFSPYIVKKDGRDIPVPCGNCPPCIKRRASSWSFRLKKEGERSESVKFITLTYATKHVPITEKGYMTLSVKDMQLFMKRLRKAHTGSMASGIRYYAVGEYGGKTFRPHYHILLFNADWTKVQQAWTYGEIHYGDLTEASIGYCLKYMCKTSKIPMHKNDDRIKEFALMSKRLGDNYLTSLIKKYHLGDGSAQMWSRMFVTIQDGKKIAMPRYYKEKLYTAEQRDAMAEYHREKMCEIDAKEADVMFNEYGAKALEIVEEIKKKQYRELVKSAVKDKI